MFAIMLDSSKKVVFHVVSEQLNTDPSIPLRKPTHSTYRWFGSAIEIKHFIRTFFVFVCLFFFFFFFFLFFFNIFAKTLIVGTH